MLSSPPCLHSLPHIPPLPGAVAQKVESPCGKLQPNEKKQIFTDLISHTKGNFAVYATYFTLEVQPFWCVCVRAALFQAQLLSVFKQYPSESTVYSKWVISLNMLQQTKRPRHAPPFRQNIAVSRRMQASRGSLGNLWIQGNAAASRKQCIEVSQRMLANMVVFYGYETERHGKPSNTIKQWRYVLHHIICF